MEVASNRWIRPLWTAFAAGLAWGMVYALLFEAPAVLSSVRTAAELWAAAPLLLSLVVLFGAVFSLLAIPLGLLVTIALNLGRARRTTLGWGGPSAAA